MAASAILKNPKIVRMLETYCYHDSVPLRGSPLTMSLGYASKKKKKGSRTPNLGNH